MVDLDDVDILEDYPPPLKVCQVWGIHVFLILCTNLDHLILFRLNQQSNQTDQIVGNGNASKKFERKAQSKE